MTYKVDQLTGRPIRYMYLACPTVKSSGTAAGHSVESGLQFTKAYSYSEYDISAELESRISATAAEAAREQDATK
jgi:hypothetical protein